MVQSVTDNDDKLTLVPQCIDKNEEIPAVTVRPPQGASPDAKDAAVSKYRGLLDKYTDKLTALCSGNNCVQYIFRQPENI